MEKIYKYPIKVVSRLTGLSVFVIRAWEKRYEIVTPTRTDTNRRLYSEEDIEKLKLLSEAVQKGHKISGLSDLSIDELRSVLEIKPSAGVINSANGNAVIHPDFKTTEAAKSSCIEAIKNYDAKTLETILMKASLTMSQPHLLENLIVPLVYEIGELWHSGDLRIANEHLASAVLRSFLNGILERYRYKENAPVFITATPLGQEHELGALIAGITAASLGWKVVYLGTGLPAEEIAAVSEYLKAKVVSLSIVYPNDDPQLIKDLMNLKRMLSQNVSIIAGGRAVEGYLNVLGDINAVVTKELTQLRTILESIREIQHH